MIGQIQFHYNGTTVDLDPQWSVEWYQAKLDSYIAVNGVDGDGWAWFWVSQAADTVFKFRIFDGAAFAFTRVGPTSDKQIIDIRTVN